MTEVPHESDSRNPMDPSLTINVQAIEKLADYVASGIGSVAGSMLAPWQARQDAKALRIQGQSQADVLLLEAEAMSQAQSLLRTPDTSMQGELEIQQRVAQRLQFQEEKRQRNIQDVVLPAAEDLHGKEVPDKESDHDWISRFFGDVQDVSSAELKTLYSRVLTGQIEQTGSTSLQTLSVLKNLDVSTAKLFGKLCSACIFLFSDGREFVDVRVPSLKGNAATNALSRFGFSFHQLNVLNEHGLIISDYNSWADYQFCIGKALSGLDFKCWCSFLSSFKANFGY